MTNIESFLPLSPMQEGMLFHTLYAPEAGEYFKRVSCVLKGPLKVAAFKAAWERVVERHAALRASFVWEGVERPLAVVHRTVNTPWVEMDWRNLPPAERQSELKCFLRRDAEQGFKLNTPPLMRFALMSAGADTHQFVWSFHHLLFDGWSIPLILKEVFAIYRNGGRSEDLQFDTPRPYRDYIAWLGHQDLAAAERFWKQYLKGFTAPSNLGLHRQRSSNEPAKYVSLQATISPEITSQLLSFARRAKVTLSSLGRAAWALLLSRYSGESDVAFGVTVSGRPLELRGVESMVGLFINTLPIRVNAEPDQMLDEFVRRLHAQQADLRDYEYSPLAEIQKWSEAPRGQALFESILVFENYPDMDFAQQENKSICIEDVESVERTSYPLTVQVSPGKQLQISLHYDTRRFENDAMVRVLGHFKNLLEAMTCDRPLHSLSMIDASERRMLVETWNDRPRPAVQSFHGAREPFLLRGPIAASLKSLSLKESATLFMALLTSVVCLLHRYSKQKDIIVGSPVAGRTHIESENLIGFFVNTLPLRCDLSGDPSFRELLNRVREITLGAYAHQDLPFEILVDEVQPERNLSRTPIYQVMLAPQSNSLKDLNLRNVQVTPLEIESHISKFDLTFYVWEDCGEVQGRVEYNTDLWDASTIKRLIVHFESLVQAAIANPDLRISQLPLLSEQERYRMLVEWNGTRSQHAKEDCVAQLFEAEAGENPNRLAVASPSAQLTYGELNKKANQLARYLKGRGVGPEVLVGVCMQRSAEMIIGLLAVLKAGGAYVPLDPAYPTERLAFMLEDAGAPVLLTQHELLRALPETTAEVICVDNEEDKLTGQSTDNLPPSVEANNLAYVIYTSGSTGKPKGVAIEHRGLLNLIRWHQHTYEVSEKDRATQLAALAFDASVWELWPYLTAGASIHIPDEETRSSPAALLQWLAEEEITLTFLATPLAEAALELNLPKSLCLKALLTGGDRLHRAPQRELPFRLMNHYGPTENTVVATYCEVRPFEEGIPPIGRPISNTQVYVLDEGMQPVPVGVAGELYIGGDSLARGYFQRPELTAEKFVANPFSTESGARLYKTGDLVRYRADAAIEFLGRIDDQVKIRGFRIELGEIAAALQRHDSVRQAIVVVREDASRDKRLVAYVVPGAASMPTAFELRHYLKNRLPDYMVPKAFVVMDKLPLTANGKVDHRALLDPDELPLTIQSKIDPNKLVGAYCLAVTKETYAPPRTRDEEVLAQIWSEVLNLPSVGIHDNFFELGGDSILSIQVVSRAAKTGMKITPKQIFRLQTIAELSQVAKPANGQSPKSDRPAGEVPLTPIQRWYFERDWEDRNAFCQSVLCSVEERLGDQHLEQAVRAVVSQHDSFRLRFATDGKKWTQRYSEVPAIAFSHPWVGSSSAEEESAEFTQVCRKVASALDIKNGPMFAGALVHFGNGGRRLFLAAHHLVVDAVSWRILLEDLNVACEQLTRGEKVELQPATTSFKTWATLLQERLSSGPSQAEVGYWERELRVTKALLPLDFPGANSLSSVEAVHLTFSEDETQRLKERATAHRSNVAEVLIAALVRSLASELDGDILVNIEGHGREDLFDGVDLSHTVGWFTSIYPVRFTPRKSFDGALREVKERMRSVPSHGAGYGALRYLSSDPEWKTLLHQPAAEIGFNFLGQFQATEKGALIRPAEHQGLVGGNLSDCGTRPHKLDVQAGIAYGKLRCSFIFSRNVHRRERIEGYARQFEGALQEILDHSVPVLTAADFRAARMGNEDFQKLLQRLS